MIFQFVKEKPNNAGLWKGLSGKIWHNILAGPRPIKLPVPIKFRLFVLLKISKDFTLAKAHVDKLLHRVDNSTGTALPPLTAQLLEEELSNSKVFNTDTSTSSILDRILNLMKIWTMSRQLYYIMLRW